jgi:hypothetical protein
MVWPLTWGGRDQSATLPGVPSGPGVRVAWRRSAPVQALRGRRPGVQRLAAWSATCCSKKAAAPTSQGRKGPAGPGSRAGTGGRFRGTRRTWAPCGAGGPGSPPHASPTRFQGETYDRLDTGLFALFLVVGVVGGVYASAEGSHSSLRISVHLRASGLHRGPAPRLMGTFVHPPWPGGVSSRPSPRFIRTCPCPRTGTGLQFGLAEWWQCISAPLPAFRSGQDHQGHAHGDHFFHRLEIRGRISPITRRTIRPVPGILRSRPEIRGRPKISHSTVKYFRVGPKRGHGQTARPGHETPVAACRVQPWRA